MSRKALKEAKNPSATKVEPVVSAPKEQQRETKEVNSKTSDYQEQSDLGLRKWDFNAEPEGSKNSKEENGLFMPAQAIPDDNDVKVEHLDASLAKHGLRRQCTAVHL